MGIERLPQLAITVDGSPLELAAGDAPRALMQVTVRQQLSLPTQCELVFTDPPGPLDELESIRVGALVRVTVVREPGELLFNGQLTAVEQVYLPSGQREIRLRGYDRTHALRKRQTVRAHVQLTGQELTQELVSDLGLTIEASVPELLHPRLIQHMQSDYDLLVSQLRRSGLYYFVRDQALHVITLEGLAGDSVELSLGDSLLEARCEVNSEQVAGEIVATGWSPLQVEVYEGARQQARSGRQVTATVAPETVNGHSVRRLLDHSMPTADHVEALAQAELDHRHAQTASFWGVARGNAALFPGARVELRGVAPPVAGRYVLTRATHILDATVGYISEISSMPPTAIASQSNVVAALGIVTDVDDPERLGRVRVMLPAYDDIETEWMHVLAPAAGPAKGLVMLPDAGDRVLVLFTQRELAQGMIVGGFFAPEPPYDTGVEGGATRRYSLRTPAGHILRLDDAGRSLRLEDSHGSYVEMTPEKVRLFANTDLEISAPGRSIIVEGNAIDFRQA